MLQVPCLSPPIYGHRHYKKFWLKQTSEGLPGSSQQSSAPGSVPGGALEMTAPPTSSDVSKRISGKRRPQLRKVESSPEHQFGWNSPSPSPMSTVENRDSDDPESCKDFFISSSGLSPVDDLPVETEAEVEKLLVRQNRSCEESSEHTGGLSQEDQVNRIKNSDTSASDSDSSTSSTSEASDHEDARRHSGKSTTFRQYLKRQSSSTAKVKTGTGDEPLVLGLVSPKTRQASALALAVSGPGASPGASPVPATTTTTTNTATVDPVSPRLGSSSPTNSIRTCHHCGTMKTPLWRNGPSGPKSLCNACGIRLRKAKRNSSQEGGGGSGATGTQASSGKRKLNGEGAVGGGGGGGGAVSGGGGAGLSKPQKKSRVPSKREVRSIPPADDTNTDWDEASAIEVLATLIQLRDAKI